MNNATPIFSCHHLVIWTIVSTFVTDSLNRNYIPITTDSLLLQATAYFDSHGTPNERLRAHYLLGCAYRDMGEAPQAIEAGLYIICELYRVFSCLLSPNVISLQHLITF